MSAAYPVAAPPLLREEETLIGHSYTRARKHPLVVGKLPGAGRIPGGPYTVTQIVTMVAGFAGLAMTQVIWAHFGVMNIAIMIALPWGLAWTMRYARLDGRDPARAIRSLLVYSSMPAGGRLAGRPPRRGRVRLASGRCTVRGRADAGVAEPASPVTEPVSTAASVSAITSAELRRSAPSSRRQAGPTKANGRQPARTAVVPAGSGRTPGGRSALQDLLSTLDES